MTTKTSTGKTGTTKGRVQARQEFEAEADELLAGVPALKPVAAFTQRDKSRLTKIAAHLMPYVDEDGNVDMNDDGLVDEVMDAFADIDEFFESIAEDPAAYREWFSSILKQSELALGTLLARYQAELGE